MSTSTTKKKTKLFIDVPDCPSKAGLEALGKLGDFEIECVQYPGPASADRRSGSDWMRDVDVLFCNFLPPGISVPDLRSLRWVQITSAGYEQLFGTGLAERTVTVTNARGCYDAAIAEWNLAMMVMLARNLRQMIRNQEAAVYDRSDIFQREIRGSTIGLWGYGGFARETARLARQFGLRVHVLARGGVRPRTDTYTVPGTGDPEGILPDRVFTAGEESAFLGGLDFLVIALPLTQATNGLIGERELRALPRTAFLLNPARGAIVQEDALMRALGEKWIAGAALDAHAQEPIPPGHPLWRLPSVIVTPHISGSGKSPQSSERLWDIFLKNAERFVQGRRLLNELTAAELSGR